MDGEIALMLARANGFSWNNILNREPIESHYAEPYTVYCNFIVFN